MSILMSSPGLTRGSKMQRIIQNSQITGSSPVKTRKREPEYMIILNWNRYSSLPLREGTMKILPFIFNFFG